MKKTIDVFDHAGEILMGLKKGCLLTTKNGDFTNTMTIGWGHIGLEWNRLTFIAYVRESRHTRTMLDNHGEFTVNIAVGPVERSILGICGTKSGRDMDKIKELGLTLVDSDNVSVPGIKELPLTLECKVIYKHPVDLSLISEDIVKKFYPNISTDPASVEQDCHYEYGAEIVGAYLIEE